MKVSQYVFRDDLMLYNLQVGVVTACSTLECFDRDDG